MAFKPLVEQAEEGYTHAELPWADKWAQTAVNPAEPRQVHWVKLFDKGYMVVTFVYKAYVNKGTQQFTNLHEALQVWVSDKSRGAQLLCGLNKTGKPVLGLDEEKPQTRWICNEGVYVQVAQEPIAETLQRERVNPLLAGRGVQATAHVSAESEQSFPPSGVPVEASGRRRKAG